MEEKRVGIKDYDDLYDITESGRIIIKKSNKARHSKGNEYGFVYVHLHKNGERKLYRTYDLWKDAFPEANESDFKGLKAKNE